MKVISMENGTRCYVEFYITFRTAQLMGVACTVDDLSE